MLEQALRGSEQMMSGMTSCCYARIGQQQCKERGWKARNLAGMACTRLASRHLDHLDVHQHTGF